MKRALTDDRLCARCMRQSASCVCEQNQRAMKVAGAKAAAECSESCGCGLPCVKTGAHDIHGCDVHYPEVRKATDPPVLWPGAGEPKPWGVKDAGSPTGPELGPVPGPETGERTALWEGVHAYVRACGGRVPVLESGTMVNDVDFHEAGIAIERAVDFEVSEMDELAIKGAMSRLSGLVQTALRPFAAVANDPGLELWRMRDGERLGSLKYACELAASIVHGPVPSSPGVDFHLERLMQEVDDFFIQANQGRELTSGRLSALGSVFGKALALTNQVAEKLEEEECTRLALATSTVFLELVKDLDVLAMAKVEPIDLARWSARQHQDARDWAEGRTHAAPPLVLEYIEKVSGEVCKTCGGTGEFHDPPNHEGDCAACGPCPTCSVPRDMLPLDPDDLCIEFYRGQATANEPDAGVRITHSPTGLVAESALLKGRSANKALALLALRRKVANG